MLVPLLGHRRRTRCQWLSASSANAFGLLLPLLLVLLLVHLQPAAAFSFSRLPSLVLGRGHQRQLQTPMAVGSEGAGGGGGGVPMSPHYRVRTSTLQPGLSATSMTNAPPAVLCVFTNTRTFTPTNTGQEEEDDVDVYLQSLKRPDASGPPPQQASRLPQRSPEELKRLNEEAKARMVGYDESLRCFGVHFLDPK